MPAPTTGAQLRAIWAPGTRAPPRRAHAIPKVLQKKRKEADPARHNAAFDKCYRGSVVEESEWEAFISCMRSPLPTTFSFVETGDREVRPSILQPRLESLVMSLGDQQDDERACMPTSGGGVRVAAGSQTIVRLQSSSFPSRRVGGRTTRGAATALVPWRPRLAV